MPDLTSPRHIPTLPEEIIIPLNIPNEGKVFAVRALLPDGTFPMPQGFTGEVGVKHTTHNECCDDQVWEQIKAERARANPQ